MNLSNFISNMLLFIYKTVNQTGALDLKWPQSVFISSYFFYKKKFEDANAKFTKNYPELFQNGHIIDIGANIGYTAYVYSKALSPSYKVFTFEPETRNIIILKRVAQKYRFLNKLVMTAAAVGNKEGEIEIWQNDGHHADHRILTDEFRKQLKGAISIQKTRLITIDHFLKSQNISAPIAFIKIDVQGYELAVCEGMQETLQSNPHCVVGFEYCPSLMKTLGYNPEKLIQFFQEKNYFFYLLNINGELHSIIPDKNTKLLNDIQTYIDIVCSRKKLI